VRKKDNKNLRVWRTDERRVLRQQGEIRAIGLFCLHGMRVVGAEHASRMIIVNVHAHVF
jgi:hypothetical protein